MRKPGTAHENILLTMERGRINVLNDADTSFDTGTFFGTKFF